MRPALLLLLLLTRCAADAPDDAGPWRVGATVASGWRLTALERQPEFARLRWQHGADATVVELGARADAPSEWATLLHRVQPAPGETPPEALLVAVRDGLRAWEAGPTGRSLLAPGVAATPRRSAAAPLLGALVAAWALALAGALGLLWRREPRARRPLALVAAALAAAALAAALEPASRLPVGWLTVLHEGTGRWHVEQLYARGVHAGPLAAWLARLAAGGAEPGLRDVVWLNTWLAVVNLGAGAASAWLATGRVWAALLFAGALVLCPPFVLSAGSELVAQPALTLAFGAAAGLALLARTPNLGERALACASLALAVALVGLLRTELLLPAGAALGGALARTLLGDAGLAALTERARIRLGSLPARAALAALLIGAGLAATAWSGPHLGKLEWAVAGLNPLHPSIWHVPAALTLTLPLGGALLVLVALTRALVVPGAPWLMPLALLVLVKTAVAASLDNPYVLTRLLAYVAPLALLASLPAWPALVSGARRWNARARHPRLAGAALAALALTPGGLAGLSALAPWHAALARDGAPAFTLDRDTQAEVRALVRWTEAHPDCVVLTRLVAADRVSSAPLPWQWKAFGRPLAEPIELAWRQGDDPARVAAEAAPRATCRLLYCGLDTNLTLADGPVPNEVEGCPEAAGLPVVEEWRFASRPYVRAQTFGEHRSDIRLRLVRLPRPGTQPDVTPRVSPPDRGADRAPPDE